MNQTDNRYTLLYGLTLFEPDDRTPLCSVEEVADFLLTHDGGIITEPDGAVLLEVEDRLGYRFPAKTNKKRKGR